jgi:hypothetical protein
VVRSQRHLAEQVAGHQHRAALVGERAERVADPADPFRIQTVDRFVEQKDRRVTEQRSGDAEPLTHPEGETADAAAAYFAEADQFERLGHPAPRDAVAGGERPQMVLGAAPAVHRARVDHRADLTERIVQPGIGAAVDGDDARVRPVQAEDHPHRRRLPRPIRAEEAGHPARSHHKGQIVHCNGRAVALGEVRCLDHSGLLMWAVIAGVGLCRGGHGVIAWRLVGWPPWHGPRGP